MCVNYRPVQRRILRDVFGVEPPVNDWPEEIWPDQSAPIVLADPDGQRNSVLANFRIVPYRRIGPDRKKYETANARFEDLMERSSFRGPWAKGQLCLIPATSFYEPNYEHGPKSVRYRIWLRDAEVFAIAGLWRRWPDGEFSFSMLTVNAQRHALMSRMHAPGKEKRSIVIVPQDQWDDWLSCRNAEVARTFMTLYPTERMETAPAPLPPRTSSRATSVGQN